MPGAKTKGSKKRGRGRVPEISRQKIDAITTSIRKCCPKTVACKVARVSYPAFKNWMNRGREAWARSKEDATKVKEPDRLYVALFIEVDAALAETIEVNLGRIQGAGERDWKAAAWLTERLDPDNFAVNRHELAAMKRIITDMERQISELKKTKPVEPTPEPSAPVPVPKPIEPAPKPESGNQQ